MVPSVRASIVKQVDECGQDERVKSSGSMRRNEQWRDEGALRSMVKGMVQSNLIDAKAGGKHAGNGILRQPVRRGGEAVRVL